MKAESIKGRGVVSVESGARLGAVDDLLFDTRNMRLGALRIKSGDQQAVIPADEIRSFGEDAVTVVNDASAHWGSSGGDLEALPRLDELHKLKVVDEAGTLLGTVHEVELEPAEGRIETITARKGGVLGLGGESTAILAREVTSVGDQIIVVPSRGDGA